MSAPPRHTLPQSDLERLPHGFPPFFEELGPKGFAPILSSGELLCGGQLHTMYSHRVGCQISLHFCVLRNEGVYGVRGQRLLDIGSGPTIYQVLSACENFEEIYLSDYIEQNRQQLQCWLDASPDAFDWNHIIKFVCKIEGNQVSWEEKAAKLRKRVRAVMHCDVRHDPPLDTDRAPFDCIMSSFCLDVACTDEKNFRDAVTYLANLLKPGGLLLTVVATGREFYSVGKEKFGFAFVMSEDMARHAMEVAGLEVTICESHSTPEQIKNSKADFTGFLNMAATKPQ
uniref:Nicotinamide N-methyltransferase n=1 Tax=Eptatretus burgeri TaxID=7764 RepID=A0A8C4Q8B2_EPTBU